MRSLTFFSSKIWLRFHSQTSSTNLHYRQQTWIGWLRVINVTVLGHITKWSIWGSTNGGQYTVVHKSVAPWLLDIFSSKSESNCPIHCSPKRCRFRELQYVGKLQIHSGFLHRTVDQGPNLWAVNEEDSNRSGKDAELNKGALAFRRIQGHWTNSGEPKQSWILSRLLCEHCCTMYSCHSLLWRTPSRHCDATLTSQDNWSCAQLLYQKYDRNWSWRHLPSLKNGIPKKIKN
jgi:hypothetical protein